jgi:cytochrome c553
MKSVRLFVPAAMLLAAFLATNVFATPEMGKKEKKACVVCHEKGVKPTKENPALNAAGKYYKDKKTLEGAPAK